MSQTFDRERLERNIIAVVNMSSGGVDAGAPAAMEALFVEAGLPHASVICVEGDDVEEQLRGAATSAEVVIVLGGDGTIRTAATHCARAGKALIPLPGGTMNMLPRALYGSRTWPDVLMATLTAPVARSISGGVIGRHMFFCAAVLGAPSLWADAREALRRADVKQAIERAGAAIEHRQTEPLRYQFSDRTGGAAEAIAIICPLVSRALAHDEPHLEVAAIEPLVASSLFRLAFHALFDDWRLDPSVALARVDRVDVQGDARMPAILDGEKVRLGKSAQVRFLPSAFLALAPDPASRAATPPA